MRFLSAVAATAFIFSVASGGMGAYAGELAKRMGIETGPKLEVIFQTPDILRQAREAIIYGEVEKARELYGRALTRDLSENQRARSHNGMCVVHILERAFDDALEHCNMAIRIRPNDWRFYNNRGNIYLETGALEAAIGEYERGLKLSPQSEVIRRNLALANNRVQPGMMPEAGGAGLEKKNI